MKLVLSISTIFTEHTVELDYGSGRYVLFAFWGWFDANFHLLFFSGKSATQPKMRWIGKLEMEKKIGEKLTDKEVSVSFVLN